jgi:alpha-tubulin suppressor-like RCC1 family protein
MSHIYAVALAVWVSLAFQGNRPVTSRSKEIVRREAPALSSVSAGTEHACGLAADGRAYCWGSNRLGQLGNDDPSPGRRSSASVVATGETFVAISAGANHTCAVTRSGEVFCWGLNFTGELGQAVVANDCGGFRCSRRPVRVESSVRFDTVSAGFGHTCALSGGRAFCWGRNDRGQLGSARVDEQCEGVACTPSPIPVSALDGFTSISAGGDHTCGMAGGSAYCWGSNQYGQLGVETGTASNPRPLQVVLPERVVAIRAKGIRTCARTERSAEVCWGGA